MKICSICQGVKPLACFSRRSASKDGLSPKCKECAKARDAAYYLKNPDKAKLKALKWKHENHEATLLLRAKYRAKYRETIAEKNRARYAADIDAERLRSAAYHAANPSKALERGRRWATDNPEAVRAMGQRRRAKVSGAHGTHTGQDIAKLMELQHGKCVACFVFLGKKYHVDHIVAIANGGGNGPANLQLLCPLCNRQKGAKHPEDFMRQKGFLL